MKKYVIIEEMIFKQRFVLIPGVRREEYAKIMKKLFKSDVSDGSLVDGEVRTIEDQKNKRNVYITIWTNSYKPELIAHECYHAAWFTLDCRGIVCHETYAYFIEYLVGEMFNMRKNKKV